MPNRDVVVIGGSAGASESVKRILRQLPRDFAAPVFIVLHTEPVFGHLTPRNLALASALEIDVVDTQRDILPARAYFPIPDHHLVVRRGCVQVTHGPHENMWRPAIDVLFRSAAVAYGTRVIAVLLSGNLDDGTAGLAAVKECGGMSIIQDPHEAESRGMVDIAAATVEIDHSVRVERIPRLLLDLISTEA